MSRSVSVAGTVIVLALALASGCGGGGPADGGYSPQGRFGQLVLRIARPAAAARLEVRGNEVQLQVSSASFLQVLLFPLPLVQTPVPAVSREFEITPDTTSLVVGNIPVGTYLLQLISQDSNRSPLAGFTTEVTILAGAVASVQASLTPISSPSPTPTATPGPIQAVTTTQLPAEFPRIAMNSSGDYAVTWLSNIGVPAQVVGTSFDASGVPRASFQDLVVGPAPAGFILTDHSVALSEDGQLLVAYGKEQVSPFDSFLDYEIFDPITGASLRPVETPQQGVRYRNVHASLPRTAGGNVGLISAYQDALPSFEAHFAVSITTPPDPPGTPTLFAFECCIPGTVANPASAMDEIGNFVMARGIRSGGTYDVTASVLSASGGGAGFDEVVGPGVAGFPEIAARIRGNRMLVTWNGSVGDDIHLFYSLYRYDPANLNQAPTLLGSGQVSTGLPTSNRDPDGAINPADGSFLVLWTNFDGSASRIMGRAYRPDGTAGPPFEVGSGTQDMSGRVAMDEAGNFRAVWVDSSTGDLFQRAFPAGFGLP